MKTAIFLGAGASAAENAPIQSALFKKFFESSAGETYRSENLKKMHESLTEFFGSVFGINLGRRSPKSINFPTFEEALGVLDLSELRGESLRTLGRGEQGPGGPDAILSSGNKARLLRLYLVLSMSKAIEDALGNRMTGPVGPHDKLIDNLDRLGVLNDTVFVSTNYDLLIDSAVLNHFGRQDDPTLAAAAVDYGVEFAGPARYLSQVKEYKGPRVKVLKIHGSLNWLYCQTCNNLNAFGRKIVMELVHDPSRAGCEYCGHLMAPVIVPPTYYKNMSNVFLGLIWNRAEKALREVEQVIFCGYSFPDADMHIKYLLKRAQTNRPRAGDQKHAPLSFTVINNPPPNVRKTKKEKRQERERFERFLGKERVTYDMENTFQNFAAKPGKFFKG